LSSSHVETIESGTPGEVKAPPRARAALVALAVTPFLAIAALQITQIRRDPPANLTPSAMPFTDEALKLYNARNAVLFGKDRAVEGDYSMYARDPKYTAPVKHAIDVAVFSLFGVGFAQARAVSIGAFFASMIAIFLAVSKARTLFAGYMAALVFGLSTLLGMYFRLATGYSLGMFFLAAFLAIVAPVLSAQLDVRMRRRFFAAGLVLAAGVFSKTLYYGLVPGALVAFAVMDWRDGRLGGLLSGRAFMFGLAVATALAARLGVMGYSATVQAYAAMPARAAFEPQLDMAFFARVLEFLRETGGRMGFVTLLCGFYVLRLSSRSDRFDGLVVALVLGQVFCVCLQSYVAPRHFLAAWGILAVIGGVAISDAHKSVGDSAGKRLATVVAGALVGLVLLGAVGGYSRWLRTTDSSMVRASTQTADLIGESEGKLLLGNMAGTLAMENRLRTLALLGPVTVDKIERAVEQFAVTHFAHIENPGYLPRGFHATALFEDRFRRIETFHLGRFETTLYEVTDHIDENLYANPSFDSDDAAPSLWELSPGADVSSPDQRTLEGQAPAASGTVWARNGELARSSSPRAGLRPEEQRSSSPSWTCRAASSRSRNGSWAPATPRGKGTPTS